MEKTMQPQPPEPEYQVAEEPALVGLPHSREAEEAVIGSVLIRPDCYFDIAQFLKAEDFYIHRLRFIWEAFVRLHDRRVPVDMLTVSEELNDMGYLDEVGGQAYLASLLNQVPSSLHSEAYGRIVHEGALRRGFLVAANTIATLAYDQAEDIQVIVSKAEQAVFQVVDSRLKKGDTSAKVAISALYDQVDTLSKTESAPGILTGHLDFDALTGGLIPGTSGLVAARPGVGKTSLLLTWIAWIMMQENPPQTVMNSMEMSAKRLMGRLAAIISGIDAEKIKNGSLTDEDWPAFNHAVEVIGDWPLVIIDERDPLALLSKITHMQASGECDLLMNDYVGKFEAKADSRVRQVGIASQVVSKIAVRLNIPVVTAAQVSRTIDTRGKDSELVLSDLKETGDLEQDADWVLFINPDSSESKMIKHCRLAKNRDGSVGTFDMNFIPRLTKFTNSTRARL
jgi:replicative DNA helicase